MSFIDVPANLELSRSLFLFNDARVRAKEILADIEQQKQRAISALAEVILQRVEAHGTPVEAPDKTYWYRTMPFTSNSGMNGFSELIEGVFGKIDWVEFYLPALFMIETTKASWSYEGGAYFVTLNERLTPADAATIIATRSATPPQ